MRQGRQFSEADQHPSPRRFLVQISLAGTQSRDKPTPEQRAIRGAGTRPIFRSALEGGERETDQQGHQPRTGASCHPGSGAVGNSPSRGLKGKQRVCSAVLWRVYGGVWLI